MVLRVNTSGLDSAIGQVGGLTKVANQLSKVLIVGVTLPITMLGAAALAMGMKFDQAFADVKKILATSGQAAGTTEAQFATLRSEFLKISLEQPVSMDTIMKVAALGAQAGVSAEQLPALTRTMLYLKAAVVDLNIDVATNQMALFLREMGDTADKADNAASTITTLGNSFPGATADVLSMAQVMGGFAHAVGISEDQVLGMSNALVALGIRPELGGRAMGRLMLQITETVDKGGPKLAGFARVAGMAGDEFSKSWKSAPADTIQKIIVGMQRMREEGVDVTTVLGDLDVTNIRLKDPLLRAASAEDTFTNSMQLAAGAWKTNDAHIKAAKIAYDTMPAGIQGVKNAFGYFSVALTDSIKPAFMNQMTKLAAKIAELANWFRSLTPEQAKSAIHMAEWAAAAGPLLYIGSHLVAALQGMGVAFMKAATSTTAFTAAENLAKEAALTTAGAVDTLAPATLAAATANKEAVVATLANATATDANATAILALSTADSESVMVTLANATAKEKATTATVASAAANVRAKEAALASARSTIVETGWAQNVAVAKQELVVATTEQTLAEQAATVATTELGVAEQAAMAPAAELVALEDKAAIASERLAVVKEQAAVATTQQSKAEWAATAAEERLAIAETAAASVTATHIGIIEGLSSRMTLQEILMNNHVARMAQWRAGFQQVGAVVHTLGLSLGLLKATEETEAATAAAGALARAKTSVAMSEEYLVTAKLEAQKDALTVTSLRGALAADAEAVSSEELAAARAQATYSAGAAADAEIALIGAKEAETAADIELEAANEAVGASWLASIGPIGWVVIAIVAVVTVMTALYFKVQGVRDVLDKVGRAIKTGFLVTWHALLDGLKSAWHVITSIVVPAWNHLKETTIEVWQKIKATVAPILGPVIGFIKQSLGIVGPLWHAVWTGMRTVFEWVWKGIGFIIGGPIWLIIEAISLVIRSVGYLVTGLVKGFTAIYNFIAPTVKKVAGAVSAAWNTIVAVTRGAVALVSDIMHGHFAAAWDKVKSVFQGGGNIITTALRALAPIVKRIFFKIFTEWIPAALLALGKFALNLPLVVGKWFEKIAVLVTRYFRKLWTDWIPAAVIALLKFDIHLLNIIARWFVKATPAVAHFFWKLWTDWIPKAVVGLLLFEPWLIKTVIGMLKKLAPFVARAMMKVFTDWLPYTLGRMTAALGRLTRSMEEKLVEFRNKLLNWAMHLVDVGDAASDWVRAMRDKLGSKLAQISYDLHQWVSDLIKKIKSWLGIGGGGEGGAAGAGSSWVKSMKDKITTWLQTTLDHVKQWFVQLPSKIRNWLVNAPYWLYDTGQNIINGLKNGILAKASNLLGWIPVFGKKFKEGFDSGVNQDGGPRQTGQKAMDDVRQGITDGEPGAENAAHSAGWDIKNALTLQDVAPDFKTFMDQIPAALNAGLPTIITVADSIADNINIHMTPDEIAKRTAIKEWFASLGGDLANGVNDPAIQANMKKLSDALKIDPDSTHLTGDVAKFYKQYSAAFDANKQGPADVAKIMQKNMDDPGITDKTAGVHQVSAMMDNMKNIATTQAPGTLKPGAEAMATAVTPDLGPPTQKMNEQVGQIYSDLDGARRGIADHGGHMWDDVNGAWQTQYLILGATLGNAIAAWLITWNNDTWGLHDQIYRFLDDVAPYWEIVLGGLNATVQSGMNPIRDSFANAWNWIKDNVLNNMVDGIQRVGGSIGLKLDIGRFHSGGEVPGTKGREILAAVLPGEYVVNPAATASNIALLHAINSGQVYHDGGMVRDPYGSGYNWVGGQHTKSTWDEFNDLIDRFHAFARMAFDGPGGGPGKEDMSEASHQMSDAAGEWTRGLHQWGKDNGRYGGQWEWVKMAKALVAAGAWPGFSVSPTHATIDGTHSSSASRHYQGLAMDLRPSDAAVSALASAFGSLVWWNNERESANHDHFEWMGGGGAPTGYGMGSDAPGSFAAINPDWARYDAPPFHAGGISLADYVTEVSKNELHLPLDNPRTTAALAKALAQAGAGSNQQGSGDTYIIDGIRIESDSIPASVQDWLKSTARESTRR